ncbi:hypothetical protein NDI45_08130 [Leptolyngbya sp. GB1-A1]|uniref:hypothetical protein n=1 Tax=Leptolyngbya sp. GB1-A1 TaxID=2933908 RepID=UPI003298AB32
MTSRRFYTREIQGELLCQLCLRRSCDASIAQQWLLKYGVNVRFRFTRDRWYCSDVWLCETEQQRRLAERLTCHCGKN